jgi:hypothetical protein
MIRIVEFVDWPICYCTDITQRDGSYQIPVKNKRKTISIEIRLIRRLEKGERSVDICRNGSLIVAYVQLVIMLIELQKVLSQVLK